MNMTYLQTNFFNASFTWLTGVFLVSLPFLLFFNNKKLRIIGLSIALIAVVIQPFGLTCWTHPLASTGMWWPAGGWLALAAVLLLIPVFCRRPVLLALFLSYKPVTTPANWNALNTNFFGLASQNNSFANPAAKDFKNDFVQQIFKENPYGPKNKK